MNHTNFIKQAIELAIKNVQNHNGGPFGAIIVKDEEIIAEGVNLVTATNDPTAHAEMVAIRSACKKLASFQLTGCTLYSSCEPCPMCLGALYWARPDALYFSATKENAAVAGFDDSFIYEELSKPFDYRAITTKRIPTDLTLKAFDLWKSSLEKRSY